MNIQQSNYANWVLKNELAIGISPLIDAHIKQLKSMNIKSILSLCSAEEFEPNEYIKKNFIYSRVALPDHKKGRSPSRSEIDAALKEIKRLKNFGSIYIHCVAAVERSPLICMAWLIKEKKLNINDALEYLMRVNPSTNPLSVQLKAIKYL